MTYCHLQNRFIPLIYHEIFLLSVYNFVEDKSPRSRLLCLSQWFSNGVSCVPSTLLRHMSQCLETVLVVTVGGGDVTGIWDLEVRDSTKHSSVNGTASPPSLFQELSDPKSIVLRVRNPDPAPIALKLLGKKHNLRININFAFCKIVCSNLL